MKLSIKYLAFAIISFLLLQTACTEKEPKENSSTPKDYKWVTKESGGYEYKTLENDPSNARFYTLENGLTVILSPSKKEPRIQTLIATKAGSNTDPATHTGLAHYLEHMLFKGTDKFGSLDWEKEKPLLDSIEVLYEKYNSTTDENERKEIYKLIDKVSGEAAKFAIANEYDKMMSEMGAQGTNAFTSSEQTVYLEDIPSNVISKYLAVQAERFRNPVFRIFHTELEAVYEEKNRSLDSDGNKVYEEMFRLLFPNNNYGKQTTIGTIEHLKNPSLVEIRKYYENYYVPNNMGIIMAGDFNPDEVIKEIDEKFSYMKAKEVPAYTFEPEKEIEAPISGDVYGPEPERLMIGYRFPGAHSEDAKMLDLVGEILTNGSAGLIDINLVLKQKLLGAYAFPYVMKDYGTLLFGGNPIEGQTLEEVKDLLLGEVEKLKSGDFSEEIITAIINNEKKDALESNESYTDRAYELMDNFVLETDWKERVTYVDWLSSVSKQDIIDFANKYLKDNYVVIYKRQGEDKETVKVDKPAITPVEVNRDKQSEFLVSIAEMPENKIDPVWMDFEKDIQRANVGNYEVLAVKNKDNSLFDLAYRFETGKWDNKLLPFAAGYLEYIGTEEKDAEDFSTEFYNLASNFWISVNNEETTISLDGLQENFKETVTKFDDLLKNCVADQEALDAYILRIKKSRANAKDNKYQILQGLRSYATYGKENPFNFVFSDEELDNLKAEDLISLLHDLANYPHKILYYGPESAEDIAGVMKEIHPSPEQFVQLPEKQVFQEIDQTENSVLLANYDMVQAEVFWVRNNEKYREELVPSISLFNQYFGGGMNSVVFQTIRESKALAYSTYAYYQNPSRMDGRNFFMAYVGAQSDKFPEAVDAMNELLTTLPLSEKSVENAKSGLKKKLATERVNEMSIIYSYLHAKKMGRNHDIRKIVYEKIDGFTAENLNEFHKNEISGKPYTYCIVAEDGKLDAKKLNSIGKVQKLSLEEIFGY